MFLKPRYRRDDRVADCASLERMCGGNSTEGSNPSLSAISRRSRRKGGKKEAMRTRAEGLWSLAERTAIGGSQRDHAKHGQSLSLRHCFAISISFRRRATLHSTCSWQAKESILMSIMDLPEGMRRVECPEPVEGLSWVYMLLLCPDF